MGCPEPLQHLDLVHHSNVCPQGKIWPPRKPGGPCYIGTMGDPLTERWQADSEGRAAKEARTASELKEILQHPIRVFLRLLGQKQELLSKRIYTFAR